MPDVLLIVRTEDDPQVCLALQNKAEKDIPQFLTTLNEILRDLRAEGPPPWRALLQKFQPGKSAVLTVPFSAEICVELTGSLVEGAWDFSVEVRRHSVSYSRVRGHDSGPRRESLEEPPLTEMLGEVPDFEARLARALANEYDDVHAHVVRTQKGEIVATLSWCHGLFVPQVEQVWKKFAHRGGTNLVFIPSKGPDERSECRVQLYDRCPFWCGSDKGYLELACGGGHPAAGIAVVREDRRRRRVLLKGSPSRDFFIEEVSLPDIQRLVERIVLQIAE
jgi:hypothetical protein